MMANVALVMKASAVKPSFVMENDLNNIRYFSSIVEHGSLTAASESLGVAKSMLSQRLASLEKELGVQLITRTSRRLRLTDVGKRYYAQCQVILNEVARASGIAESIRTMPRGKVRISCPVNFAQSALAPILASFQLKFPEVEVVLAITNRTAALIDEGCDFAVHIGTSVKPSNLVTSSFNVGRELLVASPGLLLRFGIPRTPADLKSMPSAAGQQPPDQGGRYMWHLHGPEQVRQSVQHFPRLLTEDLWVIKESALMGCAVAALPPVLCRDAIDDGRLLLLLPEWALEESKVQLIYHSRRGLTAAARALIDYLSAQLRTGLRGLLDSSMRLELSPYRQREPVAGLTATRRSQRA